jgi:ribosomal protein L31E
VQWSTLDRETDIKQRRDDMTRRQRLTTLIVTVGLTLASLLLQASVAQSAVAKMTKEELRAKLGSPDVVIVDARLGKDWKASEEKIPGAIRVDLAEVESLASKYAKDQTLIFYCA